MVLQSYRTTNLIGYTALGLSWGLAAFLVAEWLHELPLGAAIPAVVVLALPLVLAGTYGATVRRIRFLAPFQHGGVVRHLLGGRLIRLSAWTLWALFTTPICLLHLATFELSQWLTLAATIPLFAAAVALIRDRLADEMRSFALTAQSLAWGRALTTFALVLVATLVLLTEPPATDPPATLQEAFAAADARLGAPGPSALIDQAARVAVAWDALGRYATARLGEASGLLAAVIQASADAVLYFNATLGLSAFLIPVVEYRRLFGPLTEADVPPPITPGRLAGTAAVISFIVLFVLVPVAVQLDLMQQRSPWLGERFDETKRFVEQIDDSFYREGTLAQLQAAKPAALLDAEQSTAEVRAATERAFEAMEANVDGFLDWYYSLGAEYARLGRLLIGDLETYLAQQLTERLGAGNPFAEAETKLADALAQNEAATAAFRKAAADILAANRIGSADDPRLAADTVVVERLSFASLMSTPVDLVGFEQRLLAGAGVGAASGVVGALVAKSVVSKVVAKGGLKLAAQGLGKILASKAAGASGGTAAGATVGGLAGSVVPGLGTAIGATIGGIIGGVVTGVAVDATLLRLDEAVNRDEFRADIIAALRATRADVLAHVPG